MARKFNVDPYPGQKKILFIGWPESSHTHSWIDLIQNKQMNVRLFCLPSKAPPEEWLVKSYVTEMAPRRGETEFRSYLVGAWQKCWSEFASRFATHWKLPFVRSLEDELASVLQKWRPDIIHTMGFDPASYFLLRTRERYPEIKSIGIWIAQARGGPDIYLKQYIPLMNTQMRLVVNECDYYIADNLPNYELAKQWGLSEKKLTPLGVVSGTGGVYTPELAAMSTGKPSTRERRICWVKAYENPACKALPVFEALKMIWDQIKPCKIDMYWVVQDEVLMWFAKLPETIRNACVLHDRQPREKVLSMLARSRCMLAPSVTDGVPNCMLEAMTCGAFPIVSPLETIIPHVKDPDNVFFARNLYPHEIADVLVRAMNDDRQIDIAAENNLQLVQTISNRATVREAVCSFYESI